MTDPDPVSRIARAVLYEGYLLYPYRAAAVKNQFRWTMGTLFPRDWAEAAQTAEPWRLEVQCLVEGGTACQVEVSVRFLHVLERLEGHESWQEATERRADAGLWDLARGPRRTPIRVDGGTQAGDGGLRRWQPLRGELEVGAEPATPDAWRLALRLSNLTPFPGSSGMGREQAALRAMASAHCVLRVRNGRFVSLADPPGELRRAAAACRNAGAWPVLVGDPGARDTLLASPIVLEDYPAVAAESPQDLFDATEIDELLTLRVLTLTEEEKEEVRRSDPRARQLLERAEALSPEARLRLHASMRRPEPGGVGLRVGDRVRLRPGGRADVFDLALAGRIAVVQAIERDYEDRLQVAVVLEDDPGRDLGLDGWPGHRFFFRPEEVERA